jgi:hypothetical protein
VDLEKTRKSISEKFVESTVTIDGGEAVVLKFPLLSIGDLGELKDKTGIDIWDMLLSISSGMDDAVFSKMSDEDIEKMQRKASLDLLKKIDQKAQLYMLYLSLRRGHQNATLENVDYIVTYGMDQADYIKVINFLIHGVSSAQAKEIGGSKNAEVALKGPEKEEHTKTEQ